MAARFLVVFILCAVAAWAQAQPAEPAAGSVAGVVMDALTHARSQTCRYTRMGLQRLRKNGSAAIVRARW
ncbi:MAG: hypothetical protein ACLQPN_09675 [Bryobacteraceae bacterium]